MTSRALTVARLVAIVPGSLHPYAPTEPPEAPLDGVHISELPDPTPYLHGGELLLTTGLGLPDSSAGCRLYVTRLSNARVAALALGLGPVHTDVPDALADACERQGLPLLVVPDEEPFQNVTRAYWESVEAEHERTLHATIDSHRRLVAAAATDDPVPAVLAVLAEAVGGWTTLTDPAGHPLTTWPPGRAEDAARLVDEVRRLRPAGARSAATFPVGDAVASLHPVVGDGETLGYLGTVSSTPMSPNHRGLLLSTLALLGSDAAHRRRQRRAERSRSTAVALLVEEGRLRAAEGLSHALGIAPPPPHVRVLVARGPSAAAAWEVLATVLDGAGCTWWGASAPGLAWALVHPAHEPGEAAGYAAFLPSSAAAALGIGPVVPLGGVSEALATLEGWSRTLPSEGAHVWRPSVAPFASEGWAREVLAPLQTDDPELLRVVACYLRHRGRWEPVARETGLHRNSVRARIARAEQALQAPLDDPDVAARVWLALRASGTDGRRPGRHRLSVPPDPRPNGPEAVVRRPAGTRR